MLALAHGAGLTVVASGLPSWLSARSALPCERAALRREAPGPLQLVSVRPIQAGESVLELRADACLTASAAYADREIGRDLLTMANKAGPGFQTVALAAYLAVERVRCFEAESWYAGSAAEQVGVEDARRPSAWAPLTSAHWEAETLQPSTVDRELLPLVQQGIELVTPIVELAARRAWIPGARPPQPLPFSDAWQRASSATGGAAWSRTELYEVLSAAFARVLSHQWAAPPAHFAASSGWTLGEPAERWGYGASSPDGPALLPLLEVLAPPAGRARGARGSLAQSNVALGVPPKPEQGNAGEGVCVRCVATRRVEPGERLLAAAA